MKTLGSGALSFLLTFFLWANKEKMKNVTLHTPPRFSGSPPLERGLCNVYYFNLFVPVSQHPEVLYKPEFQSAGSKSC